MKFIFIFLIILELSLRRSSHSLILKTGVPTKDEIMQNLPTANIQCPYCWETIEVLVDCSVERQEYIEDCSVCCRPITIIVESSDGDVVNIESRTEDE
ncbi:CPXCG motif-containing cysteine-rich protein [Methylomonas montana]|uniref:CPXCG motif-containing cysteine-rich protein n=1 Tax=Methylomonas montana TaxID=3058963 RepID=UPI002A4E126C|nr:CPXCG motif-containing cysteine-rich protein [Methylomonas montana]